MKTTRHHSGTKALLLAACCFVALPLFSVSTTLADERATAKKKKTARSSQTVKNDSEANREEPYGYRQSRSARPVTSTWSTDTPTTRAYLRQDAYGTPRRDRGKHFVTGSLIKQDVTVNGNSADTASPLRVYGQQDLRARGGGFGTASALRNADPSIRIDARAGL